MIFDLTRLNSNIDSSVDINKDYKFSKEQLENTELIELNCHIEGAITKNLQNELWLDCYLDGVMILPCAITLKPTKYEFSVDINDSFDNLFEKNDKNYSNSIDIFPIIWENILMEIPMRVVSESAHDVKLSGDGWKLITDEDNTSSPLAELEDLFMDREVR